eukprot:11205536-Lingulodinium_polyedra.AAC.1
MTVPWAGRSGHTCCARSDGCGLAGRGAPPRADARWEVRVQSPRRPRSTLGSAPRARLPRP